MDINRNAPATAFAEVVIAAPIEVVRSVRTDIDNWSRWNPDVLRAKLQGPLAPGTEFRWKAGGLPIVSMLEEVVPRQWIVWTGRTMGIRAVHVWAFGLHEEGVLVRTEESFEGLLVRIFRGPVRRVLASSLEKGLAGLKVECE